MSFAGNIQPWESKIKKMIADHTKRSQLKKRTNYFHTKYVLRFEQMFLKINV
jgi:hypothetical protein